MRTVTVPAHVMESKILYKSRGFTIVEILVALTVTILLFTTLLVLISPIQLRQKARDNKRINDLYLLDRIITEYKLDTGSYPDLPDIPRYSNVLPAIDSISFENASRGWIHQNLSAYNSMLPTDPLNDATYFYTYQHNDAGYEINAQLEFLVDTMVSDTGNDPNRFELGSNLSILSP